jgi:IS4 transposase
MAKDGSSSKRCSQAKRSKSSATRYRSSLRRATVGLLPQDALPLLPAKSTIRWTSMLLVLCAILMSWSSGPTLVDRFDATRRCLLRWYPGRRRPGGGYEGFIAALRRRSGWLVRQVCRHYRGHVKKLAEDRGQWVVEGWLAFGADSTKHDAPMTAANERRLGVASKKGSWPQMVLTTLVHLGTHLPWAFARGRATSSERRHVQALLHTLPPEALLLTDAGFVGYGFWKQVIDSGRSFLIRVGSNVRLIEDLGLKARFHDGVVWVWPADQQKNRQPPLVLRLITLTDERNRTMHLLTNVLEPDRLSDQAAAKLYRLRWGIELAYRALKQTLNRRKLLSDSPRNARVELAWAIIGLWTLLLIKAQRCRLPGGQGIAQVLRVLRRAMDGVRLGLAPALSRLKPDRYKRSRSKKARHWPHRKRPQPPGSPKARNATAEEIALAAELESLNPAA